MLTREGITALFNFTFWLQKSAKHMIPSSPKSVRSLAYFGNVAGSVDVKPFNCSGIQKASSILSMKELKNGRIVFSLKYSTSNCGVFDRLVKQAPADYAATSKNSCNLPE